MECKRQRQAEEALLVKKKTHKINRGIGSHLDYLNDGNNTDQKKKKESARNHCGHLNVSSFEVSCLDSDIGECSQWNAK